MADGLNRVQLLGNIGQQPELRHTTAGTAVLSLRLATNERRKRGDQWQEHTEWHTVALFGKRAEGLSRILAKGSRIYIGGKLSTTKYQDKAGADRWKTEVLADEVILCDGRRDGARVYPAASGGEARPVEQGHLGDALAEDDIPF